MDLNLKGMDENLVGRAKMAAYGQGHTLKEYVIDAINEKLSRKVEAAREAKAAGETAQGPRGKVAKGSVVHLSEVKPFTPAEVEEIANDIRRRTGSSPILDVVSVPQHNPKTCRLYNCGMCRALGIRDKNRGLGEK